ADLVAHYARNTNPTRLSERFEARCDIHSVSEDVVLLCDHIPEVDPDAESDVPLLGYFRLAVNHPTLHLDRTAHGIHDTRKFREQAVAGVFDDPAVMLADLRIHQLAQMRLEPFVRTFLIGAHQPRVAGNVSGQDRCKTAGRSHGSSNPPCSGLSNAPIYRQPAYRNILPSRVVLTPQRAPPGRNERFPPS